MHNVDHCLEGLPVEAVELDDRAGGQGGERLSRCGGLQSGISQAGDPREKNRFDRKAGRQLVGVPMVQEQHRLFAMQPCPITDFACQMRKDGELIGMQLGRLVQAVNKWVRTLGNQDVIVADM